MKNTMRGVAALLAAALLAACATKSPTRSVADLAIDRDRGLAAVNAFRAENGLKPLSVDERLMEINVGSWAGLTWTEVQAQMPDYEQKYAEGVDFRRSPEGETLAEVVDRGRPALLEIAERHEDQTVLIVSHGLFLNRVIHSLLGIEGRVLGSIANAHHSELGHAHGAWRLLSHNVG